MNKKLNKNSNKSILMPRGLVFGIGFTLVLITLAIFSIYFVYQISTQPNFEGEREFVITKGENVNQISQNLYEQGLIKSKFAFKAYLYLRRLQGSVQAGTYILTPMDIIDLTKILIAGKVDNEISLRFIEGWTLDDIAEYLVKQKIINNKNDFLNNAQIDNFRSSYPFLEKSNSNSLEGFIFPDTYRVFKNASVKDIIIKTLDNFNKKLTPALKTEIKARGKSLYDVLIMASILEKEVPNDDDRRLVAGILWKRLKAKMPLQVDSTLNYVTKGKNPSLTKEELKIDSPYNTYKYRGLPPTPICNPGESAIRAAIYPKNSEYWYYLSTKDGKTIFSKTLEEHNRAVEKYLR